MSVSRQAGEYFTHAQEATPFRIIWLRISKVKQTPDTMPRQASRRVHFPPAAKALR